MRTNPIDKSPDLGLLIMSYIVENAISLVCGGKIVEISSISVSCRFTIGTYGIRVNKTIIDGKKAKKKLNANDDARVVIDTCLTPL